MLPRTTREDTHTLYGRPDVFVPENLPIESRMYKNRKQLWITYQGVSHQIQTYSNAKFTQESPKYKREHSKKELTAARNPFHEQLNPSASGGFTMGRDVFPLSDRELPLPPRLATAGAAPLPKPDEELLLPPGLTEADLELDAEQLELSDASFPKDGSDESSVDDPFSFLAEEPIPSDEKQLSGFFNPSQSLNLFGLFADEADDVVRGPKEKKAKAFAQPASSEPVLDDFSHPFDVSYGDHYPALSSISSSLSAKSLEISNEEIDSFYDDQSQRRLG